MANQDNTQRPDKQRNNTEKHRLGWRYAAVGLAVVAGAILVTTMVAMFSVGEAVTDEARISEQTQALLPLTGALMFICGVIAVRMMRGREYDNRDIGLVTPMWYHVALGVGAGLVFWVITWLASILIPSPNESTDALVATQDFGDNIIHNLLPVFAAVVAAPLGEELLFRGLLFRGIYDGMRRQAKTARGGVAFGVAAIVSGLVFAVVHGGDGQESQFVFFVLFSVMAAWVYLRTGSLYVPVLMHSVNNALYVLGLALGGGVAVSPIVFAAIAITPAVALGVLYITQQLLQGKPRHTKVVD